MPFTHNSRLAFSRFFAKLLASTAVHKSDAIIRLINTPLRPIYIERERGKRRERESGVRGRKVIIKEKERVYAEREREHERKLVRAENRVDCLHSRQRSLWLMCSTNQRSQFRLRHHVCYVTALIQTNKALQCNSTQLYRSYMPA